MPWWRNINRSSPESAHFRRRPALGAYTYQLVSGTGGDDNGSFRIIGDLLQTNAVFDFATKSVYTIRVRTTDSLGFSFEKQFTITVVAQSATVSLGDFVWNDLNGNGIQNSGESGIAGVAVELFCSPSNVIGGADDYSLGQTVTDFNGKYHFNLLLPGQSYYLVFHAPSGFTFSPQNAGSDDTIDSDVNSLGMTGLFTVTAGTNDNSIDAGLIASSVNTSTAFGIGSTDDDVGQSIATDSAGNVYVTGSFHGTVDFDPGPGVYNLTSAGGSDIFVAKYTPSGSLVSARAMGGAGDDLGTGIAVNNGGVYVAGGFSGTADFQPGQGTYNLSTTGDKDAFVLKLDSSGNFVWARDMGGNGDDIANAIALGPDGSVFTTGYFQNTADFDPGTGVQSLTAIGPKDVFVSKLDSNGNYVWAKRMGGLGWSDGMSIGMGIAVDGNGNVFTTGSFQGVADFDPGAGVNTLSSPATPTSSSPSWIPPAILSGRASMGGSGEDYGAGIALAPQTAPSTQPAISSDSPISIPGTGTYTLNSSGNHRVFISKLDASGNFVWADGVGGTGWDLGTGIAVASDGSVYATGGYWGAADFDPGTGTVSRTSAGEKDAFLLKLNSSGNYVMVQTMGGVKDDAGNGVALAPSGDVYTTGYFQSVSSTFAGTYTLTSAGGLDMFVAKYSPPHSLTVSINQAQTQADPTSVLPVHFTVVFNYPVTDFTTSDVVLGGTATGTIKAAVPPLARTALPTTWPFPA